MDMNDVVELSPLFCLGPLLLVGAILFVHWAVSFYFDTDRRRLTNEQLRLQNVGLHIANVRAELDLPLVPVYNGVHKMYVARQMLVDGEVASTLVERAIETTRAKPLDQLQNLNYAPRIAGADAQASADMQDAMSTIDGLLEGTGGELDMRMGANGNGKH